MVAAAPEIIRTATATEIESALHRLRLARRAALAFYGSAEGLQTAVVTRLAAVAREWLDPDGIRRERMQPCSEPFSYDETWPSLEALCLSMTEDALWDLIDSEQMRGVLGPEVIGHVIAGNTPLLAWTSAVRALLIGSASLLKLPSGVPQPWSSALFESLFEEAPRLAGLIAPRVWSSDEADCTRVLCVGADKIVAYGSDETMRSLRRFMPPGQGLLEYGHRMSCAIVAQGADEDQATQGIGWDTWVYDQGGCLSPQCVFVEGDRDDAARFGQLLASTLARMPAKARTPEQAATIQEQRFLARMNEGIILHEGERFQWTVCVATSSDFRANDAPMFIYVVPADFQGMIQTLRHWADHLQSVCLCTDTPAQRDQWVRQLRSLGLTQIVEPVGLQSPSLSWQENGCDVLRSLLRAG